jgi:hypothetical protein
LLRYLTINQWSGCPVILLMVTFCVNFKSWLLLQVVDQGGLSCVTKQKNPLRGVFEQDILLLMVVCLLPCIFPILIQRKISKNNS